MKFLDIFQIDFNNFLININKNIELFSNIIFDIVPRNNFI